MRTLICDFETRSSVSIADCGAFKYIESPDFRPLLLAYAFDDEPVKLVDFTRGEDWPYEFVHALGTDGVLFIAHNAAFEREVIHKELGYTDPAKWLCTMHLAAQCGLPLSLAQVCEALGFGEDKAKMKEGSSLIRWFCVPTKDGYFRDPQKYPEKWDVFRRYCIRDVESERSVFNALKKWPPSSTEHRFWELDAKINENGINTDRELVRNAVAIDSTYKDELARRAVELTGLSNPNSTAQVKHWLEQQEGIVVPSLNKKQVADVVSQLSSKKAKEFMTIRAELSKTSTKKYEAIIRSAGADGHVRGCFQFYGANRTGRFAGRLVQLQNLPQNHMEDLADARELVKRGDYASLYAIYGDVSKVLSELIRTALIPEPGDRFIVADYSAIEARVIAWLASEEWRLKTFRDGGDIYCASASQMFGVPVVKHGINGELRQKGKVAELALGYGGGPNAMLNFGADKLGMSDEEIANTVALWREKSPRIVALWKRLEKAAIRCVVSGRPQATGIKNVAFHMSDGVLWMTLPSERRIAYWGAKYDAGATQFSRGREVLSYMGKDQATGKWTRIETWGGKLTENLVQATARDCLRDAMLALDAAGYDIRAHVHDEVIITEPIDGRSVEQVCEIMGAPLNWAPGLPLRADGYETPFYMKD